MQTREKILLSSYLGLRHLDWNNLPQYISAKAISLADMLRIWNQYENHYRRYATKTNYKTVQRKPCNQLYKKNTPDSDMYLLELLDLSIYFYEF